MKKTLLVAVSLAVVSFLPLSGCIIVSQAGGGNPPAKSGNVTFTWTFAGSGCADVPDVKSVQVEIPGETLQNSGIYPCTANNYPGIVLHDFAPGTYTFKLTALSYSSAALFSGSGTFTVNGDVSVTVDLTPVGGGTSYAYLMWTFPANTSSSNPTCQQAGVTSVDLSIDGASPTRVTCASGQTSPGVQTPYLAPGSHTVTASAVDSSGYRYYRYSGTLTTFAGSPVSNTLTMVWAVGGVAVNWTLANSTGSVTYTCATAGVQNMAINFLDSTGHYLYGVNGDPQACSAAPVVYSFLPPGNYYVYITGAGTGGTYRSNEAVPPLVTVQEGVFPSAADAVNVLVYKQ